jgi:hypothetical protein
LFCSTKGVLERGGLRELRKKSLTASEAATRAIGLRENSEPGKRGKGLKPGIFPIVYGPTKSRALIQNRAFPQPVTLFPETKSSSHAGCKAKNFIYRPWIPLGGGWLGLPGGSAARRLGWGCDFLGYRHGHSDFFRLPGRLGNAVNAVTALSYAD